MAKKRTGVTRREFLQHAALASGAMALTSLAPTAALAAQAGEAKIGSQLIGKLEGPSLILDPDKWPKKFAEAPMLAEMVKAGKLPPVEKRIPEEPMVVKPLQSVGKYGGTWRRGFTGPGDGENGNRIVSTDKILFWDYTGTKIMPCLAKDWKVSDDGRVVVITLRKGHQVVRRPAVHRGRLRLLVRRRVHEQGHPAEPASRLHGERQAGTPDQARRLHGHVRVPRAELPVRGHPGGEHRHGRRPGHPAALRPHHGRLHARPLHQAVPAEVLVAGRGGQEGQGGGIRRLAELHQEPLGLAAEPRVADARPLEDRQPDQHADLGVGAQPLLLWRRQRGEPASLHRQDQHGAWRRTWRS